VIETTGRATEVCKFSRLEDQITILVAIHSITGEEGESHSLDWVLLTAERDEALRELAAAARWIDRALRRPKERKNF
jgi:hypothetical protein